MVENRKEDSCLFSQADNASADTEPFSDTVNQTEDSVMKTMMQFFADELLPVFGIRQKVKSFAPTEDVHLELKRGLQDFNLVMDDDRISHFEFQSENGGRRDLMRFRSYEADTSYLLQRDVTTYVLFSGKIKKPMTEMECGINTYRIQPIIMSQKNADTFLAVLREKLKNGEPITREDLVVLPLLPVYGGETTQLERIQAAFEITSRADGAAREDIDKIEAAIYAMATKFLSHSELDQIKGGVKMTYLGQLLVEDGRKEGREEGLREGRDCFLKDLVASKLKKGQSKEEIADALEQGEETIDEIIAALS